MRCMENDNKVCSEFNKKCKDCALDDIKKAYSLSDIWNEQKEKEAREKFETSIPEECKKCTLLEKDYLHKTVKCLYRSKNRCMLEGYGGKSKC